MSYHAKVELFLEFIRLLSLGSLTTFTKRNNNPAINSPAEIKIPGRDETQSSFRFSGDNFAFMVSSEKGYVCGRCKLNKSFMMQEGKMRIFWHLQGGLFSKTKAGF